jgi:hypothetical protein
MGASPVDHARTFLWSYIFGPFLAFLPTRWRAMWFANRHIDWTTATIISGVLQIIFAPVALLAWMATGISRAAEGMGMGGRVGGGPMQTLFVLILAMNPITWLLFYLFLEGFGRVCASALMGEAPGTLVLYAADRLHLFLNRKFGPALPPLVPDKVTKDDMRADWQLKIESCRAKSGWEVGRLLRYEGRYYRIESCSQEGGARPFSFLLRSLAAGVPSHSVILYSPEPTAPARPALFPQNS